MKVMLKKRKVLMAKSSMIIPLQVSSSKILGPNVSLLLRKLQVNFHNGLHNRPREPRSVAPVVIHQAIKVVSEAFFFCGEQFDVVGNAIKPSRSYHRELLLNILQNNHNDTS